MGRHIHITLQRDFNLLTARQVRRLCEPMTHVAIDLSKAKLVDTEALATLFHLYREGKQITLQNPPRLFYEVIRILRLTPVFCAEGGIRCVATRPADPSR
ncbi:MAG: hypothetical protein D6790_18460 [Caldilineae bacterium]|nr:MAG: hypothetical protein D6790_18460 [Caldilineae bacterium]